jgi:hypothetical protein
VLVVAFCWAHKVGEWRHGLKPIKVKNHGRKAVSFFKYGLKKLRYALRVGFKMTEELSMLVKLFYLLSKLNIVTTLFAK